DTCKNLGVWVKVTTDVSALAGHSVTLTLLNHDDNYPGDATNTQFDDVTLSGGTPPPAVILNGDFETGDLSGWSVGNAAAITNVSHGGSFAAIVGNTTATWGDSEIQ